MQSVKDYKYSSYGEWLGKKDIIDSQSARLIYGEDEYLETFEMQHFNRNIVDIADIEEKINFEEIISNYMQKEMISLEDLKKNEKYLEEIINELRKKSNISVRKVSEILNVNRPKITKILKTLEQRKESNY